MQRPGRRPARGRRSRSSAGSAPGSTSTTAGCSQRPSRRRQDRGPERRHRLGRDGELRRRERCRAAWAARTLRRRAARARRAGRRLVPAGPREPGTRPAPLARDAPLHDSVGTGIRRDRPRRRGDEAPKREAPLAARGRARARRARAGRLDAARDHPLQPARARAAQVGLAGLPLGGARRDGGRVRPDGLHGRSVPAASTPRTATSPARSGFCGRRPGIPTSRSTSQAASPTASAPKSSRASPPRWRTTAARSASASTTGRRRRAGCGPCSARSATRRRRGLSRKRAGRPRAARCVLSRRDATALGCRTSRFRPFRRYAAMAASTSPVKTTEHVSCELPLRPTLSCQSVVASRKRHVAGCPRVGEVEVRQARRRSTVAVAQQLELRLLLVRVQPELRVARDEQVAVAIERRHRRTPRRSPCRRRQNPTRHRSRSRQPQARSQP